MVHITPETVDKFKQMFKREYGVEYSDKEGWEATHNLLGAFDWLLKQEMKQNPENYKRKKSPKINYKYVDHKDSEARINTAFDILFSEVEGNKAKGDK